MMQRPSLSRHILSGTLPGDEEEHPDDTEEVPPGEHKREPIKDPDPADTKL